MSNYVNFTMLVLAPAKQITTVKVGQPDIEMLSFLVCDPQEAFWEKPSGLPLASGGIYVLHRDHETHKLTRGSLDGFKRFVKPFHVVVPFISESSKDTAWFLDTLSELEESLRKPKVLRLSDYLSHAGLLLELSKIEIPQSGGYTTSLMTNMCL